LKAQGRAPSDPARHGSGSESDGVEDLLKAGDDAAGMEMAYRE
jgi:hypothetical protein